jgi:hypothetical protein
MSGRVQQFKGIQQGLDAIAYNDNYIHVIEEIFDQSGNITADREMGVKVRVMNEINEMWAEMNTIQTKTNTKVEFKNLQGLYSILSTMQVYTSIGYIIHEDAARLTKDTFFDLLGEFRVRGYELFSRKNADYGDAFANYGIVGVMVRMGDKIARVNSLSHKTCQVSDESIIDTFIDLYNYSIMALILINDQIEIESNLYEYRNLLSRQVNNTEHELQSIKAEYKVVVRELQNKCEHEWVRDYAEYCDSHTSHYCKKCELMN